MLRYCAGACQVNHLLRALHLTDGETLAQQVSPVIHDCFQSIIGPCEPSHLTHASFPVRSGGLGLANPETCHLGAFLASSFTYARLDEEVRSDPTFLSELQQALQRFSVVAHPATSAMTPFQGSFSTSTSEFPWSTMERKWGRQKWWNDIRQAEDVRRWSSQVDLRRRKLLELGAARHATDIAALFPQAEGAPEFSSRSWVLQARFRLGLPLLPGAVNTALRCPGCSHPQDIYGDHALCCPSLGIYARHNGVRAEVSALCTEVGLTVQHNVHLHRRAS